MKSVFPGPAFLGRGIILSTQQQVAAVLDSLPPSFRSAPIFEITDATLKAPETIVDQLHLHWIRREPVIIRLGVDPAALKAATRAIDERSPWKVGPSFLFAGQRLHFLVWNNNIDFRTGEPIWWWTRKATAIGAQPCNDESADVILTDGTKAFCDGGPLRPFESPFHSSQTDSTIVPYTAIEAGSLRPLRSIDSKAELAVDQSTAVHHRGGPARIIAPAGSGKTRVLTERLRHVVADWDVDSATVCAVAYNTRAANELKGRTDGLPVRIRTLNALALALVNGTGDFAHSALEAQSRSMMDERDVRNVLQTMVELPRKMNTDPLAPWIEALSAVRLGLQAPQFVEEALGDISNFADVFERYRQHLASRGLLDFDEQIYRAIEILLQDPDARIVAQRQCRMLLVDEFQDLTPAHILMLRLLASPSLDVFGVGDDDQVIYGYAGADPRYLVDFDAWFPGAAHHALEVNYRCPPSVVEAASNMLTRNGVRVKKTIRAQADRTIKPEELQIDLRTNASMATEVVRAITDWRNAGCPDTEIAVLTRVNVTLLPVQILLAEAGIPNTAPVAVALLERTGIRAALAYLRMALDPMDIRRSDIVDTVRRPSRKIARNVVDLMTKRPHTSLKDFRSLAASLSGNDGPRVAQYASDVQTIVDALRGGDTAAALEAIRSKVGLGEAMEVLDGSRKEADRSTHADDLAAITAVAHLHPDATTFESWLRTTLTREGSPDGVELSTVHRVKGREWDRVVIYDVSAGLMPHRLATDRAEERRVFHVALTRGRHYVRVIGDDNAPSPFLAELDAPGNPEVFIRPDPTVAKSTPQKRSPGLHAEIGLELTIPGASEGTIVELTDDAAVVTMGRARTKVTYGSAVRINGKLLELLKPHDEDTQRILTALKEWRRTTASEAKVPAYTVLHDAHLDGIASTAPNTLTELAQCNGIGAAKLERWGDEILAIIETASLTPVPASSE